jgi:hypothetical protein
MEVLDATGLAERLRWEDNEYWLHLEAESPFEKYPGKLQMQGMLCIAKLILCSEAACTESAGKAGCR